MFNIYIYEVIKKNGHHKKCHFVYLCRNFSDFSVKNISCDCIVFVASADSEGSGKGGEKTGETGVKSRV